MSELNNNDYKHILEYYQKPVPKSKRLLKMTAEKIMSEKLCRCIKKVDKENEARAIGIYTRGKFKCKGKSTVKFNKTLKNRK